ncbi:group II intron maturase-specific domain-containing protein [Hoeflea sp.]|uniref:group II intron maturase-specific domain-containing protein n=1 Tax=Hoeflea sp. TaxID=1940281 RepID=UPI003B014B3C
MKFPSATRLCVLGKVSAAEMLSAVRQIMDSLKLAINDDKTRCLRCPEEALEFLGYRIGRNYRPQGGGAYIGTKPSKASVQSICRKISAQTAAKYGLVSSEDMVRRLNRMLSGWANYYHLGQVNPAYAAVDAHTTKRLRQWLCRKHKVKIGKYARYPSERLWGHYGLIRLEPMTKGLPWAKT